MPVMRAFLIFLTYVSIAAASDWPQWRGPHRDGVSPETGLLAQWPKDGPPLLWESKGAGRGYSSMASVGGRVYTVGDTLSTESSEDEYLVCFDGANGNLVWKAKLGLPYKHGNKQWESSRSTPTIDGDLLYILTGNGEIIHFPQPFARWYDDLITTCASMLLFRSEAEVDAWCQERQMPRGAILTLEQMWALSKPWSDSCPATSTPPGFAPSSMPSSGRLPNIPSLARPS